MVVLGFQPVQPHRLLEAAKQRFRLLSEPEKVFGGPMLESLCLTLTPH